MFHKSYSVRYPVTALLLALGLSLLSPAVDIEDHSPPSNSAVLEHREAGAQPFHLIRPQKARNERSCNICFLHKLLSHSLVPVRGFDATEHILSGRITSRRVAISRPELTSLVNRGPPYGLLTSARGL